MGIEYGLFHRATKTWIDLGKLPDVNGYAMSPDRVVGFIRFIADTSYDPTFDLLPDTEWPDRVGLDGESEWLLVDAYYNDPPAKGDIGEFVYCEELLIRLRR